MFSCLGKSIESEFNIRRGSATSLSLPRLSVQLLARFSVLNILILILPHCIVSGKGKTGFEIIMKKVLQSVMILLKLIIAAKFNIKNYLKYLS